MKTVLSQKRFINIPGALLSDCAGQILGLRSSCPVSTAKKLFLEAQSFLRDTENVSAKV